MINDWGYDLETYPNVFTAAFEHVTAGIKLCYEISPWCNDSLNLMQFLNYLRESGARLVGLNNLGFDYPILHMFMKMGKSDANTLYQKAQAIIGSQNDDDSEARWTHQVFPSDRFITQIDLFKIHHFDNKARATGLKALEFSMRSKSISDLPFPVGTELTWEQAVVLKRYNAHDVSETVKFYHHTKDMIAFREELCVKYPGQDWLNFNDTKIGKQYFIMELEKSGIPCYEYGSDGRKPRQTKRPVIHLKDAILPWITFQEPEFNRVLNWFKEQSITETKGVFKDVNARVDGFEFVFGTGGIHGSVENRIIESDEDRIIIDLDVASYYPNLAIANDFYPEHLGRGFCDIYKHLFEMRKNYKKGSAQNAMLKLALNGVYGDSNSHFSPFYDPLYTMKITINGQLLLCLLAEQLLGLSGIELIQINTDGLTIRAPRTLESHIKFAQFMWEEKTGLTLERADYSHMFIRDVNNYIAVKTDGSVKRKGAYEYKTEWHQNASALVVPKVAEQVLVYDKPIRETVEQWPDVMDFMKRVKVPRTSYLAMERGGETVQLQNTTRYLITKSGGRFFKWMPPLKGKTDWRKIGVESGWNVTPWNNLENAPEDWDIDYEYYIREVEKICLILQ